MGTAFHIASLDSYKGFGILRGPFSGQASAGMPLLWSCVPVAPSSITMPLSKYFLNSFLVMAFHSFSICFYINYSGNSQH